MDKSKPPILSVLSEKVSLESLQYAAAFMFNT